MTDEQVEALRKWVNDPESEWDAGRDDSPEEIFRGMIKLVDPIPEEKYFNCGSADMEQTPDSLYRLLYLCKPKAVDFSDMYKRLLFAFTSLDERFLVMVELYKYEVGLYFGCVRECLGGKGTAVVAGWPGADNGWHCSEEGTEFFRLVTKLARRELDVYPGNNFTV